MCNFTPNSALGGAKCGDPALGGVKGGDQAQPAAFVCPISLIEFNGRHK